MATDKKKENYAKISKEATLANIKKWKKLAIVFGAAMIVFMIISYVISLITKDTTAIAVNITAVISELSAIMAVVSVGVKSFYQKRLTGKEKY